jgi:hypothetical protein
MARRAVEPGVTLSRRSLLRLGVGLGTVGGFAGCVGPGGDTPTPSGDGTPTRTDGGTPTDGGDGPTVTLDAVDDPPDIPVEPAVEVVEATATDAHPPRLRATVTNRSDGTVTVGEGRAVVFAYVSDTARNLTLLPEGGDYPVEAGCWRLREPIAITEEYRTVTLDPDEAVSGVQGVYGAADGTGCLPTGTFRFESTYSVYAGETPDTERERATWGFSLAVA